VGRIPSLTLQTFQSCNASSIVEAWRWLLAAAEANPALISSVSSFRYDLVDVGRQVLMDLFPQMYSPLVSACSGNHSRGSGSWGGTPCALAMLNTSGPMILELATDFDRLLRTETHFGNRLAEWIASARAFGGTDSAEQDWLEWNARMQVTLWGSPAPALYDYASKQWSGLVAGYHVPQWRHFLQRMGRAAASSSENPYAAVQAEIVEMAEAWVASTQPVEGVSGESPLEVGKALFSKYCK
jgi:alpha-N-acetylglucosaminidase